MAIVGPSGSGKSTLMHILGTLDIPTSGSYQLDGQDIAHLTEEELARIRQQKIGFVFQSFNLLPRATLLRNVELPMIYARVTLQERLKRAREILATLGIGDDRLLHTSAQISGGQMQRVAIARALVNDPDIILADEPTGNLDQASGSLVLDTFARIHAQGRTIILITHDMAVAAQASRIIQLRDGRVTIDSQNQPVTRKEVSSHENA